MRITYTPEQGGEPSEPLVFDFEAHRLKASAAEIIESLCGHSIQEVPGLLFSGNTRTVRTVLWFLLKGRQPALKFNDFDYVLSEVAVAPGRAERKQAREAIESGKLPANVGPEDVAAALEEMDRLDSEDEGTEVEAGKVP